MRCVLYIIFLVIFYAIALLAVAGCEHDRTPDTGLEIPAAETSIGRASLLGELVEGEARRDIQVKHAAMKDGFSRIIDYAQKQHIEHMDAATALAAAQRDRADLIQQNINSKNAQIDAKEKGDAKVAALEAHFAWARTVERWWFYVKLSVVGFVVLAIVFSDVTKAGWARDAAGWCIGFVVSIPSRFCRLWRKKPE